MHLRVCIEELLQAANTTRFSKQSVNEMLHPICARILPLLLLTGILSCDARYARYEQEIRCWSFDPDRSCHSDPDLYGCDTLVRVDGERVGMLFGGKRNTGVMSYAYMVERIVKSHKAELLLGDTVRAEGLRMVLLARSDKYDGETLRLLVYKTWENNPYIDSRFVYHEKYGVILAFPFHGTAAHLVCISSGNGSVAYLHTLLRDILADRDLMGPA